MSFVIVEWIEEANIVISFNYDDEKIHALLKGCNKI